MQSPSFSSFGAYGMRMCPMPYTYFFYGSGPVELTKAPYGTRDYSNNGTPERHHSLDGKMHSNARAPWDMNSLKAAIYAAQSGTGEVARIIASCSFKPREAACTKLISVCGRWKDAKKAREVFEGMVERRRIRPNTVIYTALVSACTTAEDYEAAVETFLQMKKAALKDTHCLPNEVTYTKMITSSENNGHHDFAVQCFEEMEERGVEGDRAVYFSALKCCLHTKSWKTAETVLSIMHGKGFAATLENYTLMLDHYGEQGQVETAVNLFITLQDLGQRVDESCCHALMRVFEVAERVDMVIMLLNAMWDEKICVLMSTYISALRVFAKTSQWKQSLSILKRIIREYVVIPGEARQLVLQVARASNNEMIVKKLEDVFNNEISGEDSSVSSERRGSSSKESTCSIAL